MSWHFISRETPLSCLFVLERHVPSAALLANVHALAHCVPPSRAVAAQDPPSHGLRPLSVPCERAGPTSQIPLCDQRIGREPTPRVLMVFPPLLRRCPLQRNSQIPAPCPYSIPLVVWRHPYCSVPRRCRFAAGDSDANHSGSIQSGGSLNCRAGRVGRGRSPYKPLI